MILKPVTLETLPVNYVLHRKIRISAQAEAGRHICLSIASLCIILIRVCSIMMEAEEEEEESVIISGITVSRAQTNFNTNKFYVKFMGTIQNYTNCPLVAHDSNVESGYIQNPPTDILPGTSEAFGGHKESYTPTGCAGQVIPPKITSSDTYL